MAYDQDSQKALENLLNEFFNNDTTNGRKREIETILSSFGQQNDAWKHCLYYLDHTRNSYVSMFCLTTLENVINKQWNGLLPECQTEICTALYGFVVENHKLVPIYIKNKLIKLVVDIARISWPHFYPEFFVNILSLARNNETIVLCITFLQTISEELIHSKEELLYVRKIELRRLLSQQIPTVFSILSGFLDNIIEKNKSAATATPPPSPTQGNHSPSPCRSFLGADMSSFSTGSLGCNVFQNLDKEKICKRWVSLPPLDPESETIASMTLNCLTQYFSWIPLSSVMTSHLLNTIFVFASLGVDPQHNKHNLNGSTSLSNSHSDPTLVSGNSLGVLAMNAINEIFSKNYVPQNFEEFLLETFRNTFHLLQRLNHREQEGAQQLEVLDPDYLDKFSEFLRLFVSLHLRRFESNSQFPLLEFLGLLFRYTFSQPNIESYISCLEVWSTFLDHLISKTGTDEESQFAQYEEALISLARGILHKIQFRQNQEELEELEHDFPEDASRDEDSDSLYGDFLSCDVTEWQGFFSHNLELLAKISDLFPDRVFSMIFEPFLEASKIYHSIESSIVRTKSDSSSSEKQQLNLPLQDECRRLHCLLRDLSSLLQGIGRLSMMFLGENLSKRSSNAMQVIQKLIELAKYSSGIKFFEMETGPLQQDFLEVHAQILSTMRAWTYWLSQLYGQQFVQVFPGGVQAHHYQDICHTINKQMLIIAADAVIYEGPPLIVNCGIQLLSSLSVLVRSPVALELHQIENLYAKVATKNLDYKTRNGIYCTLVNFLLLPWPSFIRDHKLEARKQLLASLILSLKKEFLLIDLHAISSDKALLEANTTVIIETLRLISSQMDELNGTDKFSRQVYFDCVHDVVQHAILLFPVYIRHPDVCEEILSLTVMAVQVFRIQMGPPQVVATVQSFIDVFSSNQQLYLAISECQPMAVKVMEKFLRLLELITSEPGQSFKHFIPSIISLCMDHVYPVVADKPSPDIKGALFKLLYCLLDHNWKYFFRSSVQSSLGSNSWDSCENEPQFTQIMQAIGQSLMQSDITILKQNIEALEALNSKYKLYHKGIMKRTMLGQFITVLLQIMVHRTHDLLQEEITITIYNMASVDFETFFCAFLPHFLHDTRGLASDQITTLKENFKPETDLPSFTQHVHRFVNDLRYYGMLNASLPSRHNRL